MSNWQIINEENVYENNWIALKHFNVINPNGGKGIYGKVCFKNYAIGIIPIDEEGNTWIVGQHRFPQNKYSWELPEGGCPLHEEPLEAAKRELLEETGLVANHWQQILTMDLSNSVTDEVAIIFIAKDLTQYQAQPEGTELLQVNKISLQKAFAMVANAEMTDAITVAALQKIELMMLKNEL